MNTILVGICFGIFAVVRGESCGTGTCENNGTCSEVDGYDRFQCSCTNNTAGRVCDIDLLRLSSVYNDNSVTFVAGDPNAALLVAARAPGPGNSILLSVTTPTSENNVMEPYLFRPDSRQFLYALSNISLSASGMYTIVGMQSARGTSYTTSLEIAVTVVSIDMGAPEVLQESTDEKIVAMGITISDPDEWEHLTVHRISSEDVSILEFNETNDMAKRTYYAKLVDGKNNSDAVAHIFAAFFKKGSYNYKLGERFFVDGNSSSKLPKATSHPLVVGYPGSLPIAVQNVTEAKEIIVVSPSGIYHTRNALHFEEITPFDAGVYTFYNVKDNAISRSLVEASTFVADLDQELVVVEKETETATIQVDVFTSAGFEGLQSQPQPTNSEAISATRARYEFQFNMDFEGTGSYEIEFSIATSTQNITTKLRPTVSTLDSNILAIRGGAGSPYACNSVAATNPPTWEQDGFGVTRSEASAVYDAGNGTLVFTSRVRYEDAGIYACREHEGNIASVIRVKVEGLPEIVSSTVKIVPLSDHIELHCAATAIPTPDITWDVDVASVLREEGSSLIDGIVQNSTLVISQALCLGRTVISCQASNVHGTGEFSAKEFVLNSDAYGVFQGGFAFFPTDFAKESNAADSCVTSGWEFVTVDPTSEKTFEELQNIADDNNITAFRVRTTDESSTFDCILIELNDGHWRKLESACDGDVPPVCFIEDPNAPSNLQLSHGACPETSIIVTWDPGIGESQTVVLMADNGEVITEDVSKGTSEWRFDTLSADTLCTVKVYTRRSFCRYTPYAVKQKRTAGQVPDQPTHASVSEVGNRCLVQWDFDVLSETSFFGIKIFITENVERTGCGANETKSANWVEESSSTVSSHAFVMKPNSNYSVAIQSISCSGNGSVVLANGTCRREVEAPDTVPLVATQEDSIVEANESVEVYLPLISSRNGQVSCIFIVVEVLNNTAQAERINTDAEFNDIKNASSTDIQPSDRYFAYALPACDLQTSISLKLGGGEVTECSPYEQTGRRRKREIGNAIRARNRPLRALHKYSYVILTTTPTPDASIKYATSKMSDAFEIATVPVSEVSILEGGIEIANEEAIDVDRSTITILQCKGDGDPEPTIVWTKGTAPVTTGSGSGIYQAGSDLVFPKDVDYSSSGAYTCTASNGGGRFSSNSTVHVTVVGKPADVAGTSINETIHGFQERDITCTFSGFPRPIITWEIDGSLISNGSIFYYVETDSNPQLTASTLYITDSALCLGQRTIKCIANNANKYGGHSQQITIGTGEYDVVGNKYVVFEETAKAFTKANESCTSQGGFLLNIRNPDEQKEITTLADGFEISEFLVGRHFSATLQNCNIMVKVATNWTWRSVDCTSISRYACEVEASFLPKSLVVSAKECEGDRITVDWDEPYYKPALNVSVASGRSVDLASTVEDEERPPKVLDNLLPNTNYLVKISVVPEFCQLRPYETKNIVTGSISPVEPLDVTIEPTSATTCSITWRYEDADLASVDNFSIAISQEDTMEGLSFGNETSVSISTSPKEARDHLIVIDSNLKYKASVSAVSKCGHSAAVPASGVCVSYSRGLSGEAYLAIFLPIVTVLCILLIITFFIVWCRKKRRRRKAEESVDNVPKTTKKIVSETMHRNPAYSNEYVEHQTVPPRPTKDPKSSYQPQGLYVNLDDLNEEEYDDDVFNLQEPEHSDYIHGKMFDDLDIND